MDNELIIYDQKPLTAKDVRAQVNLIQEVIKSVFQEGQHFGKIPGCGDKPTLLKPGAEKLITTFNLCPEVEVIDLSHDDVIRYRVICHLKTMSGKFVGDGVGECSSEEDKYKWRKIVNDKEFEVTPESDRRIKQYSSYQQKQVRTNPFDLANTILKMAKKRALVDATLTRTAASDIFTQDIEDMPPELFDKDKPKSNGEQKAESEDKGERVPHSPPPGFRDYYERMGKIENIFELKAWWQKHAGEMKKNLTEPEMKEITDYKEYLKTEFEEKK